jgi:hypothetical protein
MIDASLFNPDEIRPCEYDNFTIHFISEDTLYMGSVVGETDQGVVVSQFGDKKNYLFIVTPEFMAEMVDEGCAYLAPKYRKTDAT